MYGKVTKDTQKHHIQENSPFPTRDNKAARNRHGSMTKTNTNKKKESTKAQPCSRQ